MTNALENLPPEIKERLAQIMAQRQPNPSTAESPHQAAIAQPSPTPSQKTPSLMDHVIALRQEVNALNQQISANSQVVEAVGNAVGQLYQMFQPSSQPNAQGPTYSETFQRSTDDMTDY
jgi:hypothetical protein|tara:strand:- start:1291 stop:1647 length:357 start_codon:yes stop_codon:yes gene_type:complete